jgi:peptide/nickel transport system substrate-binding protein
MEKKNITIIVLAVALIGSGVGNIVLGTMLGFIEVIPPAPGQDIVYGTFGQGLVDLDPAYAYDTASSEIIENVCETLYAINWSDPSYSIIPLLATALPTITTDGLNYTIPLRPGVTFHDGTVFDAYTAKWTLDRYNYFINWSSSPEIKGNGNSYYPDGVVLGGYTFPFNTSLPASVLPTQTGIVFTMANGQPVINRTIITSTYEIKIVLNEKKASFLSVLAFYALSMLSPDSAPANRYYYNYEKLIGTGPFEFLYFVSGIEEKLAQFEDYWNGASQIDTVTYVMFDDINTMNQALLSGDINFLAGPDKPFFAQIQSDPGLTLLQVGNNFNTAWVTFNYDHLSLALRKAMAYALNYSYVIDVIYDSTALRFPTYIPLGIQYANYSLNAPTFDRTTARQTMFADPTIAALLAAQSLTISSPDTAWIAVADSLTPIFALNYTWNTGNTKRQNVGLRLAFDLRYLGIDLEVISVVWGDLLDMIIDERENMDMYMLGWAPDYLDPENYMNPIWSNQSDINGGNFYEPDVQALMDAALTETDLVAREGMYQEMQKLMVEQYYPAMPLITGINYDAWVSNFHGFVSNPAGRTHWYPCYFT